MDMDDVKTKRAGGLAMSKSNKKSKCSKSGQKSKKGKSSRVRKTTTERLGDSLITVEMPAGWNSRH